LRAAQACQYLIYSEADFEVFCPAAATRCTLCNDKGAGPPKLKFLLRFDRNVEYKRPARAYTLRDFHKICILCTSFQDVLGVKILLDLLKGLWSYGGFKLRGWNLAQKSMLTLVLIGECGLYGSPTFQNFMKIAVFRPTGATVLYWARWNLVWKSISLVHSVCQISPLSVKEVGMATCQFCRSLVKFMILILYNFLFNFFWLWTEHTYLLFCLVFSCRSRLRNDAVS